LIQRVRTKYQENRRNKGLSAHIEWTEALVVFQELAGGERGAFRFEPSGIGFEPSPYVQFEPSQGKIKRLENIELKQIV